VVRVTQNFSRTFRKPLQSNFCFGQSSRTVELDTELRTVSTPSTNTDLHPIQFSEILVYRFTTVVISDLRAKSY
jgi:hypothetical protein